MVGRSMRSGEFGNALNDWGCFVTPLSAAGTTAPPPGELIRGELDRTQFDLITIDAGRHVVTRTPAHIARTPGPLHIVTVQLRGRSTLTPSDGHPVLCLDAGDIGYWTSAVPYRWEFDGPFTLLMLRAPFATMDIAPPDLRPLIGHRFPSDRGFAKFVVPFAEAVLGDPALLVGQSGTRVLQNLVGLFTTLLIGELDLSADADRSAAAFRRVSDYISDHLAESLDLRTIAAANGMSTRRLQSLFQRRGTSVTQWVRTRRLESARQALADPTLASIGISDIAAAGGFADHAHFARVFRESFGQTPSQWRAISASAQPEQPIRRISA